MHITKPSVTTAILVTLLACIVGFGVLGAWFADKYENERITLQKQIDELKGTTGPTSSETDDWKTITDKNFLFSIKYPANYYYEQEATVKIPNTDAGSQTTLYVIEDKKIGMAGGSYTNSDKINVTINVPARLTGTTLEKYKDKIISNETAMTVLSSSSLKIDGKDAIRVVSNTEGLSEIQYFIKNGDDYIIIGAAKPSKISDPLNDSDFKTMISIINTFQFTK